MKRFGKKHPDFSRFAGTFLVALVVIALVLPSPQLCACNCCTPQNEQEEKTDSQDVPQKSCCCPDERDVEQKTQAHRCSDACRCSQTDENGNHYPCCCAQPVGKEIFLPEKNIQKTDLISIFVPIAAYTMPVDRDEIFLKNSVNHLTPLRLHLMLCVLLN